MNTYRKKNYRGKRGYAGRPHRRTADSYHQPLPTETNQIPLTRHTLTKPDVETVVDALLSGYLTQGKELERFESLLAKLTHSEHAVAMSSGTAAIHAALACLKLEPEDEIITCTLNGCGIVNMVRLCGAQPVLTDCDPNTLTLSVEATRQAITENTKAIFTNNFGGHPSDLQGLRELCDQHNLLLLEDASQGLGGKYRGHYVGNQADLTCFSFHPSRAITTCEGGAITTNNRAIADWLRQFRNHGIQRDRRFFQSEDSYPNYYQEVQILGMNYRLSELHAALGRSQLTRLDRHIERRRSIAQVYFQKLGAVEELSLPYVADWADNAYSLFPIQFLDDLSGKRDDAYKHLSSLGIGVAVHYVPVHRMPLYASLAGSPARFTNAETYFKRCLSLPLFPDLSYKDVEQITEQLIKFITQELQKVRQPAKLEPAESEETERADAAPATAREEGKEPQPKENEENPMEDSSHEGPSSGKRTSSGRRGRRPSPKNRGASSSSSSDGKESGSTKADTSQQAEEQEKSGPPKRRSRGSGRLRKEPKGGTKENSEKEASVKEKPSSGSRSGRGRAAGKGAEEERDLRAKGKPSRRSRSGNSTKASAEKTSEPGSGELKEAAPIQEKATERASSDS